MDWGQVGALFTIGCFLLAGLTLLFQIKPLPWWQQADIKIAAQPRFSKLMAAFIVLGFLVSGLTLWSVWRPVPQFPYPPDFTHLKKINCVEQKGKVFINETIEIDGREIENCNLTNVRLLFHGKDTASIHDNHFWSTGLLATDSQAICAFVELINGFKMLRTDDVAWGGDISGCWVARRFPPPEEKPLNPKQQPAP